MTDNIKIDSNFKTKNILLKLKDIHENSPHNKYWNISWNLGIELSNLIKLHSPKNILEIGTSNGFSTLWMAKEIKKNAKITTIEIDSKRFEEAKFNFQETNTDENIVQINGDVFDILSKITANNLDIEFDFIFLDAAQRRYLDLIKIIEKQKLLSKNAIIVADNVISHNNMGEFLEYMQRNYDCRTLTIDSGFLIAKKFAYE
ncbi:MAG: class I SAM-dependent methyltransferase [Nanoarchaeota archaeon]|nr:class I SAM-dependent methyltransferase [Nanoarchaeota archaeon]